MGWYKYFKTWRGGSRSYTYRFFPDGGDSFEEFISDDLEEWAWQLDHGVSDSYRIGYEQVTSPPRDWLIRKVSEVEAQVYASQRQLDFLRKQLRDCLEETPEEE